MKKFTWIQKVIKKVNQRENPLGILNTTFWLQIHVSHRFLEAGINRVFATGYFWSQGTGYIDIWSVLV